MNDNLPNEPKDTSGKTILRIFIAVGLVVGAPLGVATLAQQPDTQQTTQNYKARPPLPVEKATSPEDKLDLSTRLEKLVNNKSQTPIKIEQYHEFLEIPLKIKILSIVDNVTIMSITLNRGNCNIDAIELIPYGTTGIFTLKYGETNKFNTSCSQILEAVIKTDLGEFKFDFPA